MHDGDGWGSGVRRALLPREESLTNLGSKWPVPSVSMLAGSTDLSRVSQGFWYVQDCNIALSLITRLSSKRLIPPAANVLSVFGRNFLSFENKHTKSPKK